MGYVPVTRQVKLSQSKDDIGRFQPVSFHWRKPYNVIAIGEKKALLNFSEHSDNGCPNVLQELCQKL